ncbi:MAG: ATP-binding protein [Melioribacteraceae bacterium]|nr:ATP-binding protein [Melioribacteraceae bacterium]
MIQINRIVAFIFAITAVFTGNVIAQQSLFIEKGKENYSLGKYLSILEDKEGKLSIESASSDSMKHQYVYYNKETLNFRFTSSAYWCRFVIVDTLSAPASGMLTSGNNRTWLLIKNDPILEDIRVYYKNFGKPGNPFVEKKAGSIIPTGNKAIKANDFIAAFPIHKDIPDTIYLRVKSASQFILSFNMLTNGEYVILSSQRNMFHGVLFGIFMLLIAYNSILYFSIKNKVYLYYVLYIASFALFIFFLQGYFFEVIGRIFEHDYFILTLITVTITATFWLLLTREFLSTKLFLPGAYRLLTFLIPVAPIICLISIVFKIAWLAALLSLTFLGFYLIGAVITIMALRKGIYLARYYLLALSGIAISILISISARNNFLPLPWNFLTQNILSLGILWEALILAATVGYRFSYLRAEKEKEKALMRNQIAADLHDEVGSNLSTIALQSRLMMRESRLDGNSKEQLQNISDIAGMTTDTIRDIVWFINPFHDNSEDLFLRMKELASKMLINQNYTFSANEDNEHIFKRLPNLNKRRHVYLLFKEALNNIVKHSNADEVTISLSDEEKNFLMIIQDNGKGFNEEQITHGEGLRNLRNRAIQIGAQILIESKEGNGTKITLKVPLTV